MKKEKKEVIKKHDLADSIKSLKAKLDHNNYASPKKSKEVI